MELRQLRYLLTIAEENNFTRAAEKLFITQPALSQQIQKLEEELDAVLLDRANRQIRLTDAGEVLVHHARRIVNEVETAKLALSELDGLQRGVLRIGTVQTVNAYLMPQVVAAFTAAYPAIQVRVEELPAGAIETGLHAGDLDAGIGFIPVTHDDIEGESLFEEELVLIVSNAHPLADRDMIEVAALEGQALALLPNTFCTRRLWDAAANEAEICYRASLEMNTVGALLTAVQRAPLATVLPALALNDQTALNLHAISLLHPTPRRTVGLLWSRGGYRTSAARAFAGLMHEHPLITQASGGHSVHHSTDS